MGDNRARRLLRTVKRAAYLVAVAPVVGRLPAALGYRMACWSGDWHFRCQARKRTEMARNLEQVLGDELSPAAAQQVTREWFRLGSCGTVDQMRLRRGTRPLRRLVEIRGREHLEAALAAGKGALVCTGHFHSHHIGFSVLHASGFPVTTIGRRWHNYDAGISSAERWLLDLYLRPMRRHRQRPNIEPWPGRPQVAVLAAAALRANEVVTITIDAPPLDSDRARAVEVPFLGRRAGLLPGTAALARSPARRCSWASCPARPTTATRCWRSPRQCRWTEISDGIRALRRRAERRHPEEPGQLGILAGNGLSCRYGAHPAAAGRVTSRGSGPPTTRETPT